MTRQIVRVIPDINRNAVQNSRSVDRHFTAVRWIRRTAWLGWMVVDREDLPLSFVPSPDRE
jgi:hypothetical protein